MIDGWQRRDSLSFREYQSYVDYVEHQGSKLEQLNLSRYSETFKKALSERLGRLPELHAGSSVLCLGARTGAECEAFAALGCFAVGIDLNPGPNNRYVVHGDFHQLQFSDASVDVIYTNALDHTFQFDKVVGEIKRVLKPTGSLIAEIVRGLQDEAGRAPGAFESTWWDSLEAPIAVICEGGFKLDRRFRFTIPWAGDTCVFKSKYAGTSLKKKVWRRLLP